VVIAVVKFSFNFAEIQHQQHRTIVLIGSLLALFLAEFRMPFISLSFG
jgi:hypothetical protein